MQVDAAYLKLRSHECIIFCHNMICHLTLITLSFVGIGIPLSEMLFYTVYKNVMTI